MPGPLRQPCAKGRGKRNWKFMAPRRASKRPQESFGPHFVAFYFRFIFGTSFGKGFGTVWDDLGSVLGVVCRGKSSDFVKDILKKHSFSHDELPEPFLKPSWKDF